MSNDIVQKLRPKRQALFELVQVWLLELGIRSEITAQEFYPQGHWWGGIECYMRTYRCWVPRWITVDKDVDDYVEKHSDDEKGFWL